MENGSHAETRGKSEPALDYLEAALAELWARTRMVALERLPFTDADARRRDTELAALGEQQRDASARRREIEERADERGNLLPSQSLSRRFALSEFELDALLLALAPAVDPAFGEVLRDVRETPFDGRLDADRALAVLAPDLRERLRRRHELSPAGRLARLGLIQLEPATTTSLDPLAAARLRVPAATSELLTGGTQDPTDRGPETRYPSSLDAMILPSPTQDLARVVAASPAPTVALIQGPPGTGKTALAHALAGELGRPITVLGAEGNTDLQGWQERFALTAAAGAVALVEDCERFLMGRQLGGRPQAFLSALQAFPGYAILTTQIPEVLDVALDHHVLFRIPLEPPTTALRVRHWERALEDVGALATDVTPEAMGRRFELSGGFIRNAVRVACARRLQRAEEAAPLTLADILMGVRSQLQHRLPHLAERGATHLTLTDLVVPDDVRTQIDEIVAAADARQRVLEEWGFGARLTTGRGLSCLFDGEPGTGKSLCAEILAAELGLTLYRVNVARVLDKYVGETEKNLERVFREADAAHVLLLFDEADALFARRVDVRSSNDRFANLEVGVLLQLMERYDGLVVLTTNLKHGLDPAFERRLRFKVHFPFPDRALRKRIWRHLLPPETPVAEDVDFDRLARAFELSGGSIRNALLRAAYRAAADDRPIAFADLRDAAMRECVAAGKLYRVPADED